MQISLALPKTWTLKEIYEQKFNCFSSEADHEIRKAQVDAVLYIERMASITNTDISQWDIFDVFKNPSKDFFLDRPLVTDRADINKRMLARESQDKRGVPDLLRQLDEDVCKNIREHLTLEKMRISDAARVGIRDCHRSASQYKKQYEDSMRLAWEKKLFLAEINNETDLSFTSKINDVLKKGFWEFHDYNYQKMRLKTRMEVILTHKNEAAGIDLRVNFGKFIAEVNYGKLRILVLPWEKNLSSRGYYHPYISNGGDICWGNMSYAADDLYKSGDIPGLLELLGSLLVTYSPDATPYEGLENFQVVFNEKSSPELQRNAGVKTRCTSCEENQIDCECYSCDYCDHLSSEDHCDRHYCSICEGNRRECGCCGECENSQGNCECCSVCDSPRNDCDCCHDCESSAEDCTRCMDCDSHDGHSRTCPSNEQETTV